VRGGSSHERSLNSIRSRGSRVAFPPWICSSRAHALTNERREFSKTFVLAAPDGVRIPATHVRAPGDGERLAPVMTRERLARLR
jgi:hypothetical protein